MTVTVRLALGRDHHDGRLLAGFRQHANNRRCRAGWRTRTFGVAGTGSTTIQAEFNGVRGNIVVVPVVDSAPGVFTQAFGPRQAWMVNGDGTFNASSNPAPRNTYVAFWATGQGLVNIPQQDGTQPTGPPYPNPLLPVTVTIGGAAVPAANVVFAGLVYSWGIQINVLIPDTTPTGASVPLVVTIGGASSRTTLP